MTGQSLNTTTTEAHERVTQWRERHSILGDMATSDVGRFTVRSREITAWSEATP